MSLTASKTGMKFEDSVYNELKKYFTDGFTLRCEKEVREEYGADTTAIDIELFNNIKIKDKDKIPSKHVFIQLKWKDSTSSVSEMNSYIKCCDNIIKFKKLNVNNVYHIYGTKNPVSTPSLEALKKLKHSENIYISDMDICINTILNKVLAIYEKPQVKYVKEIEDIYDDKFNYEELKKATLIELVIKRHNYKKSHLSKHKHTDLVQILVSKNAGVKSIEESKEDVSKIDLVEENPSVIDEKNTTLEYEDPTKRNSNEKKSKLLKIGSELYNFLNKLKNVLDQKGFKHEGYAIGLHTEVLNDASESIETFLSRVSSLEGRKYNVKDKNNYDVVGRAVVFLLGDLDGYDKDAKITIAFLPSKDPKEALKVIYENI